MPLTYKRLLKSAVLVSACGLIGVGSFYASKHHKASADDPIIEVTAEQKEEAVKEAIFNLQIGQDVFSQIDEALEKGSKLSEKKLDELTYYMVQYARLPQFVSENGESGIHVAAEGFARLFDLYKQSEVEPAIALSEDGEWFVTRDIKRPKSWTADAADADDVAEQAAEEIVAKGNDDLKLEVEGGDVEIQSIEGVE